MVYNRDLIDYFIFEYSVFPMPFIEDDFLIVFLLKISHPYIIDFMNFLLCEICLNIFFYFYFYIVYYKGYKWTSEEDIEPCGSEDSQVKKLLLQLI